MIKQKGFYQFGKAQLIRVTSRFPATSPKNYQHSVYFSTNQQSSCSLGVLTTRRKLILDNTKNKSRSFAHNSSDYEDIFSPASVDGSTCLGLALTDPLQIYEAKVARGELFRDEAQYRAAVELQKLSHRLIDYTPPTLFRHKIRELSQIIEVSNEFDDVKPQ